MIYELFRTFALMKRFLVLFYCLIPALLFAQGTLSMLDDMHAVVKGETWESIASAHGLSVIELQAANPDVKRKKLKKGTLLILPRKAKQDFVPVSEVPEKPLKVIRTALSELKVGVMLPFSDKNMVEFYRGLLMSADSIRKLGVNLDIQTWDCGTTAASLEALLPNVKELDILFGPASSGQVMPLAEACRQQGIRLVLPFCGEQILRDYPLLYNAAVPASVLNELAVRKLMMYYPDKNYVVVGSGKTDIEGRSLTQKLIGALSEQSLTHRTLALGGDDFAYEAAFNQFKDNVVVLDNSSIASLDTLLSRLKSFRKAHPKYRLSILGYKQWLGERARLLADFFEADTYIISPFYYNMLDERVQNFERAYARNFRARIAQENYPRYAALGFDLGCYFLGGLTTLGDTFEQMQNSLQSVPYQNTFLFERDGSAPGFINKFVEFIHLSPEKKIELIR